ncbi:MAG: tRNA pseudouridine(13) synthase TruD [Deltaproteobacteria bacterium]|nr:tRNA pseudouridine(13) synthase TruD [Deltaproteobacteria bacterium]
MARFVPSPETFAVEEIPAYLPSGEGEHVYLWIEKQNLTTLEAANRLARALGVDARDIGYAGMKDRRATTRQWLSVLGVDTIRAQEALVDGLRVLAASRHGNKLRVGHLHGNRFNVVLRDLAAGEAQTITAALNELAVHGVPNRYGHQRFGGGGGNLAAGLAVLRGARREPDGRRRKLLLSAVQSAVFNRVLELRAAEGGLLTVRTGDILEKVVSGGQFVCADVAVEQVRVDRGEIVPTGPLPGSRARRPASGTAARELEDRALSSLGLGAEELSQVGRFLPGARRPVVVRVTLGVPAAIDESDGLRLRFSLPAGSYATVVLEALGVGEGRDGEPVLASIGKPAS